MYKWVVYFLKDYETEAEWKSAPYRIGAKIHALTVERMLSQASSRAHLSFPALQTQ